MVFIHICESVSGLTFLNRNRSKYDVDRTYDQCLPRITSQDDRIGLRLSACIDCDAYDDDDENDDDHFSLK